jgi:hypothetical protein
MTLSELSPAARKRIEALKYDRIIEKHEGPESWKSTLRFTEPEFMHVAGYDVLLPVSRDRHPKISILRCIPSQDDEVLTIFVKDMTFVEDPKEAWWQAGFLAICERLPRESFYVATVYHEWFIIDTPQA